jgi:hypothetical protein
MIPRTNGSHSRSNLFDDTRHLMPQDGWELMWPRTFKKEQITVTDSGSHNSNKDLSALWLV